MQHESTAPSRCFWNSTHRNKLRQPFLLAIVLLLTVVSNINARQITPESGKLMTLKISGKQSAYYRITKDSALYVTLTGPGTITGIMRLITPTRSNDPVSYTLVVNEGKRRIKTLNSTTSASKWHWLGSSEPAGKSRKFHVRVREGKHRLRFSFRNTIAASAAFRFSFDKQAQHAGEAPLYPLSMKEQITIQVRERTLDYAIIDDEAPASVKIIGPTRLRVISRLLYSGLMKGSKQYSIISKMDGKKLPTKVLRTKKSFTTTIMNHPEWILGRSRTFYVMIPKGMHVVTFRMAAIKAPGVALRFTIPKEDIRK